MSLPSSLSHPTGRRPESTPAVPSAASSVEGHDRTAGGSRPVNPYCRCDPCRCEAPCTCGLRMTETSTSTQWDANLHQLRHTTTQIWRPDPCASSGEPARAAQLSHGTSPYPGVRAGVPGPSDAAPLSAVGTAIERSLNREARRNSVLERYRASTVGSGHGHAASTEHVSVRTARHLGHDIEIRTTYEVLIDGEPLEAHMAVSNDGRVHYHGLPNYVSESGIELMKRLIEAFPDDYPPRD